jgi:soluble lytic murein transglycosylase-like protein
MRIVTILLITSLFAVFSMSKAQAHEIVEAYPDGSCYSEHGFEAVCGVSEASQGGVEGIVRATWPDDEEDYAIAIAACESGFVPDAYNPSSGAYGIFQFLPSTAAAIGADYASLSDPHYASVQAARLQDMYGFSQWACA